MSKNLPNMLENTIAKLREMVDVNSVVGEPIVTNDGVTIAKEIELNEEDDDKSEFKVKEYIGFDFGSFRLTPNFDNNIAWADCVSDDDCAEQY